MKWRCHRQQNVEAKAAIDNGGFGKMNEKIEKEQTAS
jgi:hypothetical protein